MTIDDFEMARFFLGEVVEVQAMGANLIEPYIAEAGDIDSAMVVLRGAGGELGQIVNSPRCSFGYDQRVEAFGAEAMLSTGNQTATSVRRSGASGTENAPPYLNFFLDRYADAYRAELTTWSAVSSRYGPSPGFADGRAALVLAYAANESLRPAARCGSTRPMRPLTPRAGRAGAVAGQTVRRVWRNEVGGLTFEAGRGAGRRFIKWSGGEPGRRQPTRARPWHEVHQRLGVAGGGGGGGGGERGGEGGWGVGGGGRGALVRPESRGRGDSTRAP